MILNYIFVPVLLFLYLSQILNAELLHSKAISVFLPALCFADNCELAVETDCMSLLFWRQCLTFT